jgi:M6 family metalloprotease-like protein
LIASHRIATAAGVALSALVVVSTDAPSLLAQERTGWFHTVYVDPPRNQRPPAPLYGLVDAQGGWTRLIVDGAQLRAAGGARALESRRVSIAGDLTSSAAPAPGVAATPSLRVRGLRSLEPVAAPMPGAAASAVTDVKPYVMLLCKFSDQTGEPRSRSWYDAIMGPTRPNMGHYYDESSYGRLSLAGSVAIGWFTLPKPYLYYYPNGGQSLQFSALLSDCVGVADAAVDFTKYAGIIVQHNGAPDWAYGGRYTLTLDGQTRSFGVAWMPTSGPAQLAHEIGHTFGFPHSSGGYGAVYDSRWDVMSNSYPYFDATLNPPDWLQQHTIAYNKWSAGWIDGANVLVPSLPSTRSVMLLHGARPPATGAYHLVRVPDPAAPARSYLAEARQRVGYDRGVPGDAVVLHTYDPSRGEPAQVIDVDRNNDPNDAGAMWTPGESYADSVVGVTIDVDSMNASGFGVTVVRGWRLRMQATGPGAITGAPTGACSARCDHIAATRGGVVTLSAQPGAGAQFVGWTGACTGTGTCAVTLAGNRTVGAAFAMPVTFTSATDRPRAIVGRPYQDRLVATGGSGSFSWAVASGTLPPGLALASSTGVLSGQPTAEGRFEFTVVANSGTLTSSKSFVIVAVQPVAILGEAQLPRAVTGSQYARTLAAEGGVGTMRWSVSAGALPAGLALESATGRLAGTPTVAGDYEFTVVAASDTLRDMRQFTLRVTAAVAITSVPARRGAVMGAAYADTVRATGGNAVFDWRVVGGALPAGLSLEPGGVLSGIPTVSGPFRFTAIATSDGLSAQREFELTVTKPTIAASAVLDQLLGGSSTLTPDERGFLDLLGNRNGRVDVGDVRAWLVDIGALQAGAPPTASMSALTTLRERQPPAMNARSTRP